MGDVATLPDELACVIETRHGLLIGALLEAGLAVYPVNPRTVDRLRKPSGAKTDAMDATLLARLGRSDLAELRRFRRIRRSSGAEDPPRDQDALIRSRRAW